MVIQAACNQAASESNGVNQAFTIPSSLGMIHWSSRNMALDAIDNTGITCRSVQLCDKITG